MTYTSSFTNHFLIAMPNLIDPNFDHTVSYICEHNLEGAMGITVNRPTELTLYDLAEQLDMRVADEELGNTPIYQGGPVQTDRGFVLHRDIGEWDSTIEVTDEIGLTMSQDIIEAIASGMGPKEFIIALGYAGWGENQLESEIAANAWLSGPANMNILFQTPIEQRWQAAAAQLGIDINTLSTDVGHA